MPINLKDYLKLHGYNKVSQIKGLNNNESLLDTIKEDVAWLNLMLFFKNVVEFESYDENDHTWRDFWKEFKSFDIKGVLEIIGDTTEVFWDNVKTFFKNNYAFINNIVHLERELSKTLAFKFNLKKNEEEAFDNYWKLIKEARKYKKDDKDSIILKVNDFIDALVKLARDKGDREVQDLLRVEYSDAEKFVIFSDHHFTNYSNKPNYFKEFNYELYLRVLNHYNDEKFVLVENGDVEELLVGEPGNGSDAKTLVSKMKDEFPIQRNSDPDKDWSDFINYRNHKREGLLVNNVFKGFDEYYELLNKSFIRDDRLIKLSGNHDTYDDPEIKLILENKFENKISVKDALVIRRNDRVSFIVMHGHQFDHTCVPSYASSLGEVYSESAWAFQGADRVWKLNETKKWYINDKSEYNNQLVGADVFSIDSPIDILLLNLINTIKEGTEHLKESKDAFEFLMESLMGNQIAWEYFENKETALAVGLELLTGDEMFKFRHMEEIELCEKYKSECLNSNEFSNVSDLPTIVLGHTHEPRFNSINPNNNSPVSFYINSGTPGRFENLIWCVEIIENDAKVCSWSDLGTQLKKITWKNDGDKLIHDRVAMFDY